jgi:hypothetical protein
LAEAQHGHSGQLSTVVGQAHRRPAAPGNDDIELACDPQARQRSIGDERQAFASEVVDHSQNPEPSGAGETFGQRAREYSARLRPILAKARASGAEIAIYGAGCRACTFTNAHELTDLVDLSVDDQKERQGLSLPGTGIPIRSPDVLAGKTGPLVCLLAVNQENEAKVNSRLRENVRRPLHVVSIFAPSDIWSELDRLEAAAGSPHGLC